MAIPFFRTKGALLAVLAMIAFSSAAASADHRQALPGPFKEGPEVTRKCLECHEDAAGKFMQTTHWTWSARQSIGGRTVDRGKINTVNNYCSSIAGNWQRCTACHAGYGWQSADFDFKDSSRVDCLVCHDTTGTYVKDSSRGGNPAEKVDLARVAQNVGKPTRVNCGACHFFGGGGDAVKHGDLDSSMEFPEKGTDIHMALDGNDFQCQDCHKVKDHQISGRSMVVSPGAEDHIGCDSCHGEAPHKESILNRHFVRVACQTCHIPTFAKDVPTKLSWDWSKAGDPSRKIEKDAYGMPTYDPKKGEFTWGKNVVPTYRWYNGRAGAYLLGDKMDPTKVTALSWPEGSIGDKKAKIYPFKTHTGKQVYDKKNKIFITPQVYGDEGYWKTLDWKKANQNGMKASGLPYSGEYDFAPTIMYWRLNHMVAPASKALGCLDCHGDKGRLDWKALGYGRDPISNSKTKK